MTKRLRIIFFITLTYFLIIIPVQSQQDNGVIANGNEAIQLENNINSGSELTGENLGEIIQENSTNDTGQDVQIEENFSGSNNVPEITENLSGDNFTNDTTGQNIQINQVPRIIISEIYYDGTEEWIEITNLGSAFSGEVELGTSQSIFFPVSLQQDQSIILTKASQTYSRISPLVLQQPLPLSFSFTDTKAIFTTLSRSGQLIDTFQVETGLVTKYNDKKTSLIKQYNNQIWFITGSTAAINVLDPYIASPGIWENGDFFQTNSGDFYGTGENTDPSISGNIQTGDSQTTSGSDLGGGGMSGIVDTPTPTSPQTGTLSITEIYQSDGLLSDFIEIQALQYFSGKVFFSGSLLKTSFNLDLSLKDQERIIIVYSDNGWLSTQKKTEKHSLDLNTSGYLQVLGQSGRVFDTIQILSSSGNKSNYNGLFSNGDIDIFSKIDNFSPGFDEKFLIYFDAIYLGIIGQNNQDTTQTGQTTSGAMSTSGTEIGPEMSGLFIADWIPISKDIQISALQYFNPESITLKSNLSFDVNLTEKDRYLLSKETQTSNRKTTKKYLTGILGSGESTTIFKTRGFLDAGSCIGLFYQTGQIDQRCYGSALPQEITEELKPQTEEESEPKNEIIPLITILGVLPNPVGKDDQEELHLLRTGSVITNINESNQLSVIANAREAIQSNYLILPEKSLYLKINSTKKYLTGTITSNQEKIFIGSLGLVNKPTCIEIRYKEKLLDTYCYPQPQEGQYLEKGKENIEETGLIIQNIPNIRIQGLLPNPKGKDDQELVSLFRTPSVIANNNESIQSIIANNSESIQSVIANNSESIQSVIASDSVAIHSNNLLLPPKTLYLLNNKTKTYFSGSLQVNTGTIFKASLGLINKAHCTELRYLDKQLDIFCYPNPKEDQYFGTGNHILQTIQKSDFSILQKVGFIVTGSQICVNYYDQMLTCRQLSAAKTSIKLKNENKLYKTYVGLLQNYLIKNWSTLYFNTPITDYFTILKNAKSQVKDFSSTITISGQQFSIYDLSGQIQLTTNQQGLSGDHIQENLSWRQGFLKRLGI